MPGPDHAPEPHDAEQVQLAEKVRALQSGRAYPEAVGAVESIETHFAWVFLTGNHAYKMKKPVALYGMDMRSLAARRQSCEDELRLNRRLAPDVYLDLVPLARSADGSLRLGNEGVIVDWLVRMRRLPGGAMLDQAIAQGAAPRGPLVALGTMLAEFYRMQPHVAFTPGAYTARIADQIHADRRALLDPALQLDSHLVEAAVAATWRAFTALEAELGERAATDRIVEAHGDLRPEHVCLADPPCVIDSLEFSRDLRILDPAEELAYLWIECEQAGDTQAALVVLDAYRRESQDPVGGRLLEFYRARRALVRARIVAWHLLDPQVARSAPWGERAESYVRLAERHARCAAGNQSAPGLEAGG